MKSSASGSPRFCRRASARDERRRVRRPDSHDAGLARSGPRAHLPRLLHRQAPPRRSPMGSPGKTPSFVVHSRRSSRQGIRCRAAHSPPPSKRGLQTLAESPFANQHVVAVQFADGSTCSGRQNQIPHPVGRCRSRRLLKAIEPAPDESPGSLTPQGCRRRPVADRGPAKAARRVAGEDNASWLVATNRLVGPLRHTDGSRLASCS